MPSCGYYIYSWESQQMPPKLSNWGSHYPPRHDAHGLYLTPRYGVAAAFPQHRVLQTSVAVQERCTIVQRRASTDSNFGLVQPMPNHTQMTDSRLLRDDRIGTNTTDKGLGGSNHRRYCELRMEMRGGHFAHCCPYEDRCKRHRTVHREQLLGSQVRQLPRTQW